MPSSNIIMFHSKLPTKNSTDGEEYSTGPNIRLGADYYDAWVVNSDSYEMNQTKERYLSCYPIGWLQVQKEASKLLLLIMVNKDNDMFEGKVAKIDSLQNIEQTTISEK